MSNQSITMVTRTKPHSKHWRTLYYYDVIAYIGWFSKICLTMENVLMVYFNYNNNDDDGKKDNWGVFILLNNQKKFNIKRWYAAVITQTSFKYTNRTYTHIINCGNLTLLFFSRIINRNTKEKFVWPCEIVH